MNIKQNYNRFIESVLIVLCLSFSMIACEKEDPINTNPTTDTTGQDDDDITPPSSRADTEQTVFMYFPWSDNLTGYFATNISDMENVFSKHQKNERIIVFLSNSQNEASLFELVNENGKKVRKTLKNYKNPQTTKAEGITDILTDVKHFSPSKRYSMIIGCHGMGWIPVSDVQARSAFSSVTKKHWEYENAPMTRYFGGIKSENQTNITTLAKGLSDAGMKMEYILFDDCYMSTVEVAYDLKNVTDHLIASTSEIMAIGMPYSIIGQYLMGNVNYESICNGFYLFYSTYSMPCGTIAVTDCSELDNLATIMKEINQQYTFNSELSSSLQPLDGYNPVIFYDYGDYVSKLCTDQSLLDRFNEQLNRAVPFKRNTEYYYSMSKYYINEGKTKINTFSGMTISDPSTHPLAVQKTETAWYTATH